jgi:hypothetical protein
VCAKSLTDRRPFSPADLLNSGTQLHEAALLVATDPDCLEARLGMFRQPEHLIELAVCQQRGVGRDLAAQEFQLDTAVELSPQIPVLAVILAY